MNRKIFFTKWGKRAVSLLTVFVMVFTALPQFDFFDDIVNELTASAASTLNVPNKWKAKRGSINISSDNTPTEDFWADTSKTQVYRVDPTASVEYEKSENSTAIGTQITTLVTKSDEEEFVGDNAYKIDDWETSDVKDSLYYTIEHDSAFDTVSSSKPDKNGVTTNTMTYGFYRQYYVSTADQLATLLYYYGNSDRFNQIKASSSDDLTSKYDEIELPEETATQKYVINSTFVDKVGIVLLNDIDLGRICTEDDYWNSYKNKSVHLEIDGQGHTIYNGYFGTYTYINSSGNTATGSRFFIGDGDNRLAIHDLTFSNCFIGHTGGMFGGSVQYAYFNNVNWTDCVAYGSGSATVIVLGSQYKEAYFKDCTATRCYVYSNSSGHSAIFASFNNAENTELYKGGNYHTDNVPSLGEFERACEGKTSIEGETEKKTLQKTFPSIYENCAVVDCILFQNGSTASHSGLFVSCMRGNVIFKNCFSSGVAYGQTQLGGFTGAVIGATNGFMYNGKLRSAVFENCYASVEIEGTSQLGGFIGTVFNDWRAVGNALVDASYGDSNTPLYYHKGTALFENCYSTSSIGMEYSSEKIGGFIGILRGDAVATDEESSKHTFINCYAAGEVGGIATDEKDDTLTIGGFVGQYFPNDYEGLDYTISSSYKLNGSMENCYYDMQTTAMRERDVGSCPTYISRTKEEYDNMSKEEKDNVVRYAAYKEEDKNGTGAMDGKSTNYAYYYEQTGTYNLIGTIEGLTGVYTKESTTKGVKGLCDMTTADFTETLEGVSPDDVWNCENDDYYPMLKGMLELAVPDREMNEEVKKMYTDRAQLFHDYAFASTAAVQLDHYDSYLSNKGVIIPNTDKTIYDTVRDITSKFDFTSFKVDNSFDSQISWAVNSDRNSESSYKSKLYTDTKSATEGFTITYTSKTQKSDGTKLKKALSQKVTHNPDVVDIAKVNKYDDNGNPYTVWSCIDFAPGKQWVQVKYGLGHRNLRLLPKAYLNAGGKIDVNVADDNMENEITYSFFSDVDNDIVTFNTGTENVFNHFIGTAYAISDNKRMSTNTSGQVLNYTTGTNKNNKTALALYSSYLITDAKSTDVGLNDDTGLMYNQQFVVTGQENNSSSGMTMVRIYHAEDPNDNGAISSTSASTDTNTDTNTEAGGSSTESTGTGTEGTDNNSTDTDGTDTNGTDNNSTDTNSTDTAADSGSSTNVTSETFLLVPDYDNEIDYATDGAKWSGTAPFTTEDVGYYYMVYYWRLNDGRYLSDLKLVNISSSSHNIEMITGISEEKQTVDETVDGSNGENYRMAIDQFVLDEKIDKTEDNNAINEKYNNYYPSYVPKAKGETTLTASNASTVYDKFNNTYEYGGETYYIKSLNISTTNNEAAVAWRRSSDYRLTSLMIQLDDGTGWKTLARVDHDTGSVIFDNAVYNSVFLSYKAEQDRNTRQFTVTKTYNDLQQITVESVNAADSINSIINFTVETGGATGENYKLNSDIRVVALFKETNAKVVTKKSVLTSDEYALTEKTDTIIDKDSSSGKLVSKESDPYYNSLEDATKKYSIDDTGLTDDESRKAVLSGDTLYYRMKVSNAGYFDSDVVNVFDTVPEGCTLVDGSLKIYRQKKNTTNGEHYDKLETILSDVGSKEIDGTVGTFSAEVKEDGTLHWQIPTVTLFEDYYVEYAVKVDDFSAATVREVLKNTAKWDFTALNGNIQGGKLIEDGTSISEYKNQAIFDMSLKDTEGTEVEYTIKFKQQDDDIYTGLFFKNTFPDGFTLTENSIKFVDGDGKTPEKTEITSVAATEDSPGYFTIDGFDLDKDKIYTVTFKGTYSEELTSASQVRTNKAIVTYNKIAENGEQSTYSNTVYKTTRLTNTVETDATHLYLNIQKDISEKDPEQSFLFKIDRYENSTDESPSETFYTRINCTGEVTETSEDAGGNEITTTYYVGNKLVQVSKRGFYKVTEMTDWSDTDYDFKSVSSSDIPLYTSSGSIYKNSSQNGSIASSGGAVMTFELPRVYYATGGFPTSLGCEITSDGDRLPTVYPTLEFKNEPSEYAFLSSQAYAENTIDKKAENSSDDGNSEDSGDDNKDPDNGGDGGDETTGTTDTTDSTESSANAA